MKRIVGQDLSKHSLCHHCANQSSGFSRLFGRIRSCASSNSGLCCQKCEEVMDMSPKEMKEVFFSAKYLWLCLDCDQIFCGAESCGQPDGHISYHAISNHHQFAIQIAAWCFDCTSLKWMTTKEEIKEINSAIKDKEESRIIEQVDFNDLPSGYIVRPMQNLGNSCFFNAILQNLLSMEALRSIMVELDVPDNSITEKLWRLFIDTSHCPDEDDVIMDHCELFASIRSRVPSFGGHQQQDSHELLRYLFNEILAEGNSFIEDTFGGKISSTVSCLECGNTVQSYEPFLDISLAIPSIESSTKKDEVTTFEDNVLPSIEESNETLTISDTKVSTSEDANSIVTLPLKKRISPFLIPKVDESLESQQKNPIAEELEDDPEDCCGQYPCMCNEDFGGVAEFIESQLRDPTRNGGEDREAEVEGLGRSHGRQSFICNSDSSEVATLPESQQTLLSEKEDSLEFLDVPKLTPLNDNLDSHDGSLSAELNICLRKRPGCSLRLKFEDGIPSDNKNADSLSIEKCLDLFTVSETLSCEYACDHCSNQSQDRLQTELQSNSKNEKLWNPFN